MMEWLLGIDRLDPSDPSVAFGWARPLPGFAWALICVAAVALAVVSYRGLAGHAARRWLFGGARALLLVALMLLLAGPQLERANERTEQDWVIVLADRSVSMSIGDGEAGTTRDDQLREALNAASPTLRELSATRRVLALGFDSGVYDLDRDEDGMLLAGDADGAQTLLGRSLAAALDRAAARPVAGVVILSDGATADDIERRSLQRLRSERIPVFAVPLGSRDPVGDLAVASVDAPAAGFVGDRVPVRVQLGRFGGAQSLGGTLELVERSTGIVLASERVGPEQTEATLVATPDREGKAVWDVRLVPDGTDLLEANNAAQVNLRLVDRPLRVLLADGYPRWEFRYLKNLLLREASISSSSLLLATGRRHIQEGDVLLARMPTSPGEWEDLDVVVLGDLRAELLSEDQQRQLRDLVSERGAGLLWIAGPGATPQSWRGTELEALLPISLSEGVAAYGEPVTMTREPLAEQLGLLELSDDAAGGWPEQVSNPQTGWSLLRWAQQLRPEQIKPTAGVLASFDPISSGAEPTPAVLTMRYGAGRVVYVATDEIWRWRYARGEALPERFWVPLVRLLGREGLTRSGRPAVLTVAPGRAEVGSTVTIEAQLLDARLVDAGPASIEVRVLDEAGQSVAELGLRSEDRAGRARRFAAAWVPPGAGVYTVETDDPAMGGGVLRERVEVVAPNDELQRPATDHPRLETLATDTGGEVLAGNELPRLRELLPNRERRVLGTPTIDPLWDTPLALLVVTLLLAFEWIGRRLTRLV
ncbi:MAG: hypothetical protein AAFN41_00195 [Planctomycetota bacterium]